jgi:hypothetical protein
MSGYPPNQYPPNQAPQNPYPQNQAPPNQYPPNQYPPNQYPPGSYPQNPYPPGAYQQNPYQQNPYQQYQMSASPYVPCPRCYTPSPQPVKFTWWGGIIGPKMLSHVKCQQCSLAYNGKSGKSNTTGIVIYSVIVFFVVLAISTMIMVASR